MPETAPSTPTWDIVGMIDALGGRTGVRAAAKKAGLPVPLYVTVKKWRERNAANSDGVALLAKLILATPHLKLGDFVTGWPENEPVTPPPFEGL